MTLLTLWFCQDLILFGQVPFFRDLGTYFYPLRLSLAESFKSGEVPLWDRRLAQGFPLLAAFQPGVFYPPHLLLGIAPFFLAIRLLFVFHFLLAAVGAFNLIRYWRHPTVIAVIGALTFTLGGTLVSLSNLLNHFQSAVWMPWVLLTWEQLQRTPDWRRFLTFTIICTLQFLAGSPEFFLLTIALVACDGFRVHLQLRRPSLVHTLGLLGGALLLTTALSMAQILPTAELFLESRRQGAVSISEGVAWSLNPVSLLNLFFLDREADLRVPRGVQFFFAQESPFFMTYYIGVASFVGLVLYFYYYSWRQKLICGFVILGFLILASGNWTPFYPFLLRHIPFIAAFRFPEKFFLLAYAVLLFVAIKGLTSVFQDESGTKSLGVLLGGICLFWSTLYGGALFGSDSLGNFVAGYNGQRAASVTNANSVASLLANLERQVLLVLATSVLIFLTKAKKLESWLVQMLLVIVVIVDLTSANKGFLFSLKPKGIVRNESENVHFFNGAYRTFYYPSRDDMHPSSLFIKGRPTYPEFVELWFRNLLPNAGMFYGIEYMQEIDALGRRPYTAFLTFANKVEPEAQIRLLRAFNVDHVVSFRPLSIAGLSLSREFPDYYSWLYKIDNPVPRAFVVNRANVQNDAMRTLQRLADSEFDPRAEVLLDREVATSPDRILNAETNILHYANTHVTVQTQTNVDGILVLLDSYYPGWKAYVDGKETTIARANHFYRAVPLPQGQHIVEFKYEPLSFKLGLLISLSTIISVIVISLLLHMRRRRSFRQSA